MVKTEYVEVDNLTAEWLNLKENDKYPHFIFTYSNNNSSRELLTKKLTEEQAIYLRDNKINMCICESNSSYEFTIRCFSEKYYDIFECDMLDDKFQEIMLFYKCSEFSTLDKELDNIINSLKSIDVRYQKEMGFC